MKLTVSNGARDENLGITVRRMLQCSVSKVQKITLQKRIYQQRLDGEGLHERRAAICSASPGLNVVLLRSSMRVIAYTSTVEVVKDMIVASFKLGNCFRFTDDEYVPLDICHQDSYQDIHINQSIPSTCAVHTLSISISNMAGGPNLKEVSSASGASPSLPNDDSR